MVLTTCSKSFYVYWFWFSHQPLIQMRKLRHRLCFTKVIQLLIMPPKLEPDRLAPEPLLFSRGLGLSYWPLLPSSPNALGCCLGECLGVGCHTKWVLGLGRTGWASAGACPPRTMKEAGRKASNRSSLRVLRPNNYFLVSLTKGGWRIIPGKEADTRNEVV